LTPENIRALRYALVLSQADMARFMEVEISSVRRWEYGIRRPGGVRKRRLTTLMRKYLPAGV
jgi:putative transcriptional regulator